MEKRVNLTTLKLTHPDVISRRDRIAAPMRLASWICFKTVMTSDDWEGAVSLLVSNLHRPDQELLVLLQSCVAGQQIASMEEAHAAAQKLPGWQRIKCMCSMVDGDGSRSLCADPVPWSRIKEHPPIHNCHGLAVALPESGYKPQLGSGVGQKLQHSTIHHH